MSGIHGHCWEGSFGDQSPRLTRVTRRTPATGCPLTPAPGIKGTLGSRPGEQISNCCHAEGLHSRGMESCECPWQPCPHWTPAPAQCPTKLGTFQSPFPEGFLRFMELFCFPPVFTQAVASAAFSRTVLQAPSRRRSPWVLFLDPIREGPSGAGCEGSLAVSQGSSGDIFGVTPYIVAAPQ